jgi:hypothetical protein
MKKFDVMFRFRSILKYRHQKLGFLSRIVDNLLEIFSTFVFITQNLDTKLL